MVQLPFYFVLIIAVLVVGLLFGFGLIAFKLRSKVDLLEAQINTEQSLISGLQKEIAHFQKTSIQLSKQHQQTEQAVVALKRYFEEELSKYSEQLTSFEPTEPVDKLYSRALKLVAKGADIEELMTECELPRVEAEMLLAIHKNAR